VVFNGSITAIRLAKVLVSSQVNLQNPDKNYRLSSLMALGRSEKSANLIGPCLDRLCGLEKGYGQYDGRFEIKGRAR
jgi:hypothetical protein